MRFGLRRLWPLLLALLVAAVPAAASDTRVLSEKQKAELESAVDEIAKFVSEGSGLELRQPLQREFADQDALRAHLEENFTAKDRERARRGELVLKKLGLLPRDFDLVKFSVELTADRVLGYYDTKKKAIFLLDYVAVARQKPILAHEVTHAIQDQHFGISEWAKAIAELTPAIPDDELDGVIEAEEAAFARKAVIEGQANVALVQYALHAAEQWAGPAGMRGRSVRSAPVMMALLEPGRDSELYKKAPVVLKESMAFPYVFGYSFVRALQDKGGAELAFKEVMQRPPATTREVMYPEKYIRGEELEPVRLPDVRAALGEKYRRLSAGVMGAFDVYVLGKHFEGQGTAEKLAKRWRGGVHYAAVPVGVQDQELKSSDVALFYLSRWESEKAAQDFAKCYAKWLRKKYAEVHAAGESAWDTDEGRILIEARDEQVLVLEGFAPEMLAPLRATVWASAP